VGDAERRREEVSRSRSAAEGQRAEIAARLAGVRVELGKLDGDLALATERLATTQARRARAEEERAQAQARAQQAAAEQEGATADRGAAGGEHERIRVEVAQRASAEDEVRRRLTEQRAEVRGREQELHQQAQTLRSLEGERAALEGELHSLRERVTQAASHRATLQIELANAERQRDHAIEHAGFMSHEAKRAAAGAEHARHRVAEAREREAMHRADRRQAEEALAQMTARRNALEELERDRVGLAPAAAALLAARDRFDGGVLGPLSDYVDIGREDAELAERLLGDWMHAVLVRDGATVQAVQEWHAANQPGALVLLPLDPGPENTGDALPLDDRLRAEGPGADWVRAALAGSQVLDPAGRVLRRASGAIFLSGTAAPSGPLRRRAEIATLAQDVERAGATVAAAATALEETIASLAERESALADTISPVQ
jgi:chromosome segregation ATPase